VRGLGFLPRTGTAHQHIGAGHGSGGHQENEVISPEPVLSIFSDQNLQQVKSDVRFC
jgi:hypothetical protein